MGKTHFVDDEVVLGNQQMVQLSLSFAQGIF